MGLRLPHFHQIFLLECETSDRLQALARGSLLTINCFRVTLAGISTDSLGFLIDFGTDEITERKVYFKMGLISMICYCEENDLVRTGLITC